MTEHHWNEVLVVVTALVAPMCQSVLSRLCLKSKEADLNGYLRIAIRDRLSVAGLIDDINDTEKNLVKLAKDHAERVRILESTQELWLSLLSFVGSIIAVAWVRSVFVNATAIGLSGMCTLVAYIVFVRISKADFSLLSSQGQGNHLKPVRPGRDSTFTALKQLNVVRVVMFLSGLLIVAARVLVGD